MAPTPVHQTPAVVQHSVRLARSFRQATGQRLVDVHLPPDQLGQQLYESPGCVLSHNGAEDPVFNYANGRSQELFEYDWETFLTLPSRLSAEPDLRADRQSMLQRAADTGFIADYSGIRISATGRRFLISNAIIWTVVDSAGQSVGQAAAFDQVKYLT